MTTPKPPNTTRPIREEEYMPQDLGPFIRVDDDGVVYVTLGTDGSEAVMTPQFIAKLATQIEVKRKANVMLPDVGRRVRVVVDPDGVRRSVVVADRHHGLRLVRLDATPEDKE